jgi:sulfofructose kinase
MSELPKKIICVGHTAFDRVYAVEAVVAPPAKVRASAYLEMGGGMAGNAAVAIARLGGNAHFWGPAGDDEIADRMQADFVRQGVDASQMRRFAGRTSSHSAILVDARGERLIVNVRGDALQEDAAWLPLNDVTHAGALLADVRWPEGSRMALGAARRAGVSSVLDGDTAEQDVLRDLAGLADYCVFSEPGFAAFSAARDARTNDATTNQVTQAGLAEALALGARVAVVTRGERGCAWMSAAAPDQLQFMPAFKTTPVDTTGAGDTFHGAITLLLAEARANKATRPFDEVLRFASAAAAIKVQRTGARSMPSRAEVEQFLAQNN